MRFLILFSLLLLNTAVYSQATVYYQESFSTASSHNWTIQTDQGVSWKWTPYGPRQTREEFPVPFLRSSSLEGWMILDDAFFGDSTITNASLISPILDLDTAVTNLRLSFEQFFQERGNDTCFVGISTDGGGSWSEVIVNDGVGHLTNPNPSRIDLNISPWLGSDRDSVRFRLRYTSMHGYGWQMDEIRVQGIDSNDVRVNEVWYEDLDTANIMDRDIRYTVFAESQRRPLKFGVEIENSGLNHQDSISVECVVIDHNGIVRFQQQQVLPNVQADSARTVYFSSYTPDSYDPISFLANNRYMVIVEANPFTSESNTGDNMDSTFFEVSRSEYGKDMGLNINTLVLEDTVLCPGPFNGISFYSSDFQFHNSGSVITGVSVFIGDSTDTGNELDFALRDSTGQIVAGSFLSGVVPNAWNFVFLESIVVVQSGQVYRIELGTFDVGGGPSFLGYSGQVSVGNNTLGSANALGFEYFPKHTPMIRLELDNPNTINEHHTLTQLSLYPNPAQNLVTISLPETIHDGYVEMLSVDGKILKTHRVGNTPLVMDVSHLAEGSYFIKLVQGLQATAYGRFEIVR